MVTRRTLSKLAGGALLSGVAGCIGSGLASEPATDGDSPGSVEDRDGSATPEASGDPQSFDPDDVEEVLTVPGPAGGDGDVEPHSVVVWNDAADSRTVDATVVPESGTLGSATVRLELAADAAASVTLAAPGDYEVRVRPPGRESPAILRVGEERFDCNASSTRVRVGPDGSVDSTVLTTLLACDAGPVTGEPNGTDGGS